MSLCYVSLLCNACLGTAWAATGDSGYLLTQRHHLFVVSMTMRRGALRAFHHQVGYAVRRLRQGCPVLSVKLLPAVRALQHKIVEVSPIVPEESCSVKWPPWGRKFEELPEHPNGTSATPESVDQSMSMTKRALRQHDTDTTCATGADDVVSDTEAWTDGSSFMGDFSIACHLQHSRKPRKGRRAKSKLHQLAFAEQVAMAARECSASSGSSWNQPMATLLECLEEEFAAEHCMFQKLPSDEDAEADSSMSHESVISQNAFALESVPMAERTFMVEMVKPSGTSLGLSLQEYEEDLLIERVLPGGAVDVWNSQREVGYPVSNLDRILRINGITGSQRMLDACRSSGQLVLEILKGPFQAKLLDDFDVAAQPPERNDNQQSVDQEAESRAAAQEKLKIEREALEEARKQLARDSETVDIQRLLAQRLERSRSLRS